ncbi:hypothetical protein CEW81_06440 [Kluyvera genomosp. 3]|uniref:Uncharacterized protein n=1 Tax=Kluyvera genomosp. 3 TaxID=2774055 RepID=A0A248KGH7_9ENTR|nr:hypothetical protein CEW81_06440 [Kluyvera genomosp. 3]
MRDGGKGRDGLYINSQIVTLVTTLTLSDFKATMMHTMVCLHCFSNVACWKGREPDQHKITAVTGGFFVPEARLITPSPPAAVNPSTVPDWTQMT